VLGDWGRGEERRRVAASAVRRGGGGVIFIGPGRPWGGGEAANGGGVLLLVGFKGVKWGRGDGTTPIQWGKRRRHDSASIWLFARGGGRQSAAHDTTAWLEVGADVLGQKAERSGPISVGVKERQKWAERRNGPKAKEIAA
jgi:hypothetical protein